MVVWSKHCACCHINEYVINIECLISQIESLCDVTLIVKVTSHRVDEMSYIMRLM